MNAEEIQRALEVLQETWPYQSVSATQITDWELQLRTITVEQFKATRAWYREKAIQRRPSAIEFKAQVNALFGRVHDTRNPEPMPDPDVAAQLASKWLARIRAENPQLKLSLRA